MVAVAETTNLSESAFLEALSSEEREEFMRDGGFDSVGFLLFAADNPLPLSLLPFLSSYRSVVV